MNAEYEINIIPVSLADCNAMVDFTDSKMFIFIAHC